MKLRERVKCPSVFSINESGILTVRWDPFDPSKILLSETHTNARRKCRRFSYYGAHVVPAVTNLVIEFAARVTYAIVRRAFDMRVSFRFSFFRKVK